MAFGRQLKLLLWKNFTLRKRQPFRIIFELLWPLILFLILMWVRLDNQDLLQRRHECHFDSKAMPSAGLVPFFQSLFCTANNTCHQTERPSEQPDATDAFNTSILSRVLNNMEILLSDTSVTDSLVDLVVQLSTAEDLLKKIVLSSGTCNLKLADVVDEPSVVAETSSRLNVSTSDVSDLIKASPNMTELLSSWSLLGTMFRESGRGNVFEFIADDLCRSQVLASLIISRNKANGWIDRLCGLDDKTQLSNIILNHIDSSKVRTKLTDCAITIGFSNFEILSRVLSLQSTLTKLQPVADSFNRTFSEIMELYENNIKDRMNGETDATEQLVTLPRFLLCEDNPVFLPKSQSVGIINQVAGAQHVSDFADNKNENITIIMDNTTNPFCSELFYELEHTSDDKLAIVWRQVKPLIRGKIPFMPNTPVVHAIIEQANFTFEILSRIQSAAIAWLQVSDNVTSFMDASLEANIVRGALEFLTKSDLNSTTFAMLARFLGNDGGNSSSQLSLRDSIKQFDGIVRAIVQYTQCIQFDKFEPFDSEENLVAKSVHYVEMQSLLAALVFDYDDDASQNGTEFPSYISYQIRMDIDRVDSTYKFKVTDRYWSPGPRSRPVPDMKYLVNGFAFLQDMIEHSIIRLKTGTDDVGTIVQEFPYPCYINDRFTLAISRTLPLFMTLAWIFSVAMIVKGIVYEKERRLKEVMKVMGLENSVHWVSWFITSFVMMLFSVVLLVIVVKGGKVIAHTDALVLFVFMIVFTVAVISQCFMFSVFFSRANLAAACSAIFYFIGYLPYTFVIQWEEYMLDWHKSLACLSSTVAFGIGCSYFAKYEEQVVGAQWNNLMLSPIPEDNFNLGKCMMMMMLDTVIYLLITWYVETVFPGEYGIPKPWYFMFTKSYWCPRRYASDEIDVDTANVELLGNQQTSGYFEAEQSNLRLGVSVRGLRKIYSNGKKVAVDGLSLNFYEGHITSFLGHNGAGKTTTMSILMGLFPPTQGTAIVYGKDIRYDMDQIRRNMGVCPQYNVLFDSLTVEEHLYFYGLLKGMDDANIGDEIEKMIKDVGLPHKRKALAKNLSGGMQRKLSIALAFTAGSKVVILDEPTAGIDPYARRSIWDLLLRYKADHTIILSTHFMDEADMLGDRIAIISSGRLMCCGSSLFLKKIFGSGYYLTLVVSDEKRKEVAVSESIGFVSHSSRVDVVNDATRVPSARKVDGSSLEQATTNLIQKHIPEATLAESFASELTYQLPDDVVSVRKFNGLFTELDASLKQLGFTGYGMSSSSLEEVFLNVAKLSGVDEDDEKRLLLTELHADVEGSASATQRDKSNCFSSLISKCRKKPVVIKDDDDVMLDITGIGQPCNGAGKSRITGAALLRRQFVAVIIKRFNWLRRSKRAFFSQIILPAFFICIAMVFAKINPPTPQMPAMEIHPWLMQPMLMSDKHLYMFYNKDQSKPSSSRDPVDWINELEGVLLSMPGMGTRCMNSSVHTIDGFPCEPSDDDPLWSSTKHHVNITESCSCETGVQVCPQAAIGAEPSKRLLSTTDYMYNLTSLNVTDWLVKTTMDYRKKRYGGLTFGQRKSHRESHNQFKWQVGFTDESPLETFADKMSQALRSNYQFTLGPSNATLEAIFNNTRSVVEQLLTRKIVKVWFDNTGYTSAVAYMNAVHNMLLRANGEESYETGITLINHPMKRTAKQMASYTLRAGAVDTVVAISVIFAMSQIPASFIVFLVEERNVGSKHLQFVSGVSPLVFWVTNFIWDICNYFVSAALCILLFIVFQQRQYVSADNAPCLVALLLLYGWAVTPMMYPASFYFTVPSTAFVLVGCINIFLGLLSTLSTFILELFMEERLDKINAILKQVFLVLPHFCLGRGLIDMTRNQIVSDVFASLGRSNFVSPFTWDLVGKNLFCLVFIGVFFFILTLCIEYKFWLHKLPFYKCSWIRFPSPALSSSAEDIDVTNERIRVGNLANRADDVLVLEGLTKMYGKRFSGKQHLAVNDLTVGIHKGECFGLLGVNGAGKTTTFKMLTGDISLTAGDARLAGYSVRSDLVQVHQRLGYCPQFDALCSLLTTKEHLYFYGRLRGVPEDDLKVVVEWGVRRLGLTNHANKRACDLSGGNRRKLSTAIALIGNPSVIFLDEPTTGMDPKARRFLWNCIGDIVKDGRSVVLTSHSMEECEALCGRIAIMVNGTFKCLGSVQHLKNRFGDGYTVIIRVNNDLAKISALKEFIACKFIGVQLKEEHRNVLHYHLPSTSSSLAQVFHYLEMTRDEYSVEDYSVSQTTLDQVFLSFAKLQRDLMSDEIEANSTGFDVTRSSAVVEMPTNGHPSTNC